MGGPIALAEKDGCGRGSQMSSTGCWEVQYARSFSYVNPVSHASTLSVIPKNRFKSAWLFTSCASSAANLSLINNASSSSTPILTVTFQGRTLEEHFVRKLQFSWPQLLCGKGSHAVFVSYEDEQNEEVLSSKLELAVAKTSVQYQPESLQQYSSEMSNLITSADSSEILETTRITSKIPDTWQSQVEHHQPFSIGEMPQFDYDGYVPAIPPRFTTLVSNCSSGTVHGQGAPASPILPEGFDLKSQIAKYMQDASFLDIMTKVEEVISELGGDSTVLHHLL